jgi:peptide methionine sulfoxide reductase MsrB
MSDLLTTFRDKAESLIAAINDRGGLQGTIAMLRRQMAEADRRRAMSKAKSELKRLDNQITEMITAVGVQAVGLHKAGRLESPELAPLCQHIVELEAAVAQQKTELAKLEAMAREKEEQESGAATCVACGEPLIEGATFCAHCGAQVERQIPARFCVHCGAELRPQARFCAKCGLPAEDAQASEAP